MFFKTKALLLLTVTGLFSLWGSSVHAVERTVVFQQDLNGYTGTQDAQVNNTQPGDQYGDRKFMWVDAQWDGPGDMQYILLQFKDIFGAGPDRVPPGATIRSALLLMYAFNNGAEDEFFVIHNLLQPWDQETVSYTEIFGADEPIEGTHYAGQPAVGITNGDMIGAPWGWDVAPLVQAYSDGLPNNGFVFIPPFTSGDAACFATSECPDITPFLEVETAIGTFLFRQGVNGYSGLSDATIALTDALVAANMGARSRLVMDANDDGTLYVGLIQFADIFGTGEGRIPPGTEITSATLNFTSINAGDIVYFYEIAKPWDEMTVSWDNWVENVDYPQVGVELGDNITEYDTSSTMEFPAVDVTVSLQKWSADPSQNHGWFLEAAGADGVEFMTKDAALFNTAPMLAVTYESDAPPTAAEVKTVSFQQGQNGYSGVQDTYVKAFNPDDVYGGLPHVWWDAQASGVGDQNIGLLQFKDIIGTGEGQIPSGAEILSARLVLMALQDGDGSEDFTFYNLLNPWDAETASLTTVFDGDLPIAGTHYAADPAVSVVPGTGERCLWNWDIAPLIQTYADGAPNNGFVVVPGPASGNGFATLTSEAAGRPISPTLIVETPDGRFIFAQGLNGYTGLQDTEIRSDWADDDEPTRNFAFNPTILLDFNSLEDFKAMLMQFDEIFGTGPGQIVPGTEITSAVLRLTCVNHGNLTYVSELLKPFDEETATWDNWVEDGNYPQIGLEIGDLVTEVPEFPGDHSYPEMDVTTSLQKWSADPSANLGWFFEITASDGFVFMSKDSAPIAAFGPELIVTYRQGGVVVEPTPSPTPVPTPTDLLNIGFDGASVEESGFVYSPATGFDVAAISVGDVPAGPETDGRGMIIEAAPGEGTLAIMNTPVSVGSGPVVITVDFRATAPGCSVALAALNSPIDGQLGYVISSDSETFVGEWRNLVLLYDPPNDTLQPGLQVAVASTASTGVTVYFDNLVVQELPELAFEDVTLDVDGSFDAGTSGILQNVNDQTGAVDFAGQPGKTALSIVDTDQAANIGIFASSLQGGFPHVLEASVEAQMLSGSGGVTALVMTNGNGNVGVFVNNASLPATSDPPATVTVGGGLEVENPAFPVLTVVQNGGPGVTSGIVIDNLKIRRITNEGL